MNKVWRVNVDVMLEFFKMVEKLENDLKKVLTKQEREIVFLKLMEHKDIKHAGNTELNKEEFLNELISKGKTVLNIDEKGTTIIKKKIKGEE